MPRKAMNGTPRSVAAAIAEVVCWSVATYGLEGLVEAALAAAAGADVCESKPAGSCTSTPSLAASDATFAAARGVVAPSVTEVRTALGGGGPPRSPFSPTSSLPRPQPQ